MKDLIIHIDWGKFHFLREEYLWLAIPIAVIILLGLLFYGESVSWKKNIAKHLQPYVIKKGTEWKSRVMHLSVLLMFVIAFISFLGPSWNQEKAPAKKIKSQFVIALDLSQSMLAKDISPTRLERAKFKIKDLLDANPRAETSLLVFAGSTHTVIPFTTDYKIILDQLSGLKPSMMPVKGTGFHALFSKLDSLFTGNKAKGKVLLISDGFSDIPMETISNFLQENNVQLYVYPFATIAGATIPSFKEKSALDMQKINSINALENATSMEITLDNSDVKDLAKAVSDDLVFEDKSGKEDENWQDNGYWLIIPLAFLFLLSFRKGWALNFIFIALSEYQAQKKYDTGNYVEAALNFEDPMRKGVAYYKAGDFISAQTAFEKDTTTASLYNLGLTYAKLGQLEKSQEIFEKVLQKDPANKNASSNLKHIISAIAVLDSLQPEEVALNENGKRAKNKKNDSPEDLSGGGQKATKKELDELPDDFKSGKGEIPKNILMRKVDDDPALFLTRKFKYQIKKKQVKADKNLNKW